MTWTTGINDMLIQLAEYRPATAEAHRNNPLIEALPDYLEWRPRDILKRLSKEPEQLHARASRSQISAWLTNLPPSLFVSTKRHYALFETIDLLIRQGYVLRNPMTPERASYLRNAYARLQSGEKVLDSTFEEEVHEQLTASLIGTSGMGKTRTVERILTFYPQLIKHNRESMGGPILQIVYLHVECPHDGSVVALCRNLLSEIDRLTEENYRQKFRITDRTTLETLKSTLVHVLALHYVGIIVIDEIQNLTSSRKNREDLFNFIVSLSNSLNVPLLFVGTPKIYEFLTSNVRTARRFGTRGFINWKPLERGSKEWKSMIAALWRYNVLQDDADDIPEAIEDKLFERSFGIVEVLLKLYILTQNRILLLNTRKSSAAERKMTPEAIDFIFDEFFKNMEPILKTLHKGDMDALRKLEDIAMPENLAELMWKVRDDIDDDEDCLDAGELQQQDLNATVAENMSYAGEDMPPVAKDIAQSIIDNATPKGSPA